MHRWAESGAMPFPQLHGLCMLFLSVIGLGARYNCYAYFDFNFNLCTMMMVDDSDG